MISFITLIRSFFDDDVDDDDDDDVDDDDDDDVDDATTSCATLSTAFVRLFHFIGEFSSQALLYDPYIVLL